MTLLKRVTDALLFSCIFIGSVHLTEAKIDENDILILNRPLNVFFGRTATLDPVNTLRIRVRAGDDCTVTVVDQRVELAFTAGKLSRTEFPCTFGPDDVKYIHYGGRQVAEDHVHMLVRYDSNSETLIIPLNLIVKIHEKPYEIIAQNNMLIVENHLGHSTPIDADILHFGYEKNVHQCKISVISVIPRSAGLPQFGYVAENTTSLTNVDCNIFLTYGIRYKHYDKANSPKTDYIPMCVQLLYQNGEIAKEEYFQLEVTIKSGKRNSPPEPSATALFVMDSINQHVMTAITPDIVSGTDSQTPSDRLWFNITQRLGPGEGIIVNTDDRNSHIQSFYQHEINDLKIAYKPPNSDSNIKRIFQIWVTIYDTEGLSSNTIPLMIVVEPTSSYAPIVTTNNGLQLVEGESRTITPQVLDITDADNLHDVQIYHIDGLRNGHLTLPVGKKYFTPADLKTGDVRYHHDDSDTFSDNIVFRMTDGTHEIEFLFPITIYPKDDYPPTLTANAGLEVRKQGIVGVSTFVLNAEDLDTDDSSILFTLEEPYAKLGRVVKRQYEMPRNVEDWQFNNGIYEASLTTFIQQDILDGKIFYMLSSSHTALTKYDTVGFRLSDRGTPPNVSPVYNLTVKIPPVDNIPPYLYPNTPLEMDIEEMKITYFRRKMLRYSDDDTNDRDIRFVITQQPYDTYKGVGSSSGMVVLCDQPKRPVFRFNQVQVNQQQICYQPPMSEHGVATHIVQFDFYVEDNAGNKLQDQSYHIKLKPIDSMPPVITNVGAVLYGSSGLIIDSNLLHISDEDTDINNIDLTVLQTPKFGNLLKNDRLLAVGDSFKQTDIVEQKITYRKLREATGSHHDDCILEVSDGSHFIAITFNIEIQPVDTAPGHLSSQGREGLLQLTFNILERGTVILKPEYFHITDRDPDIMKITYSVRKRPVYGQIFRNGQPSGYFNQGDVIKGLVEYRHNDTDIGLQKLEDSLMIVIRDNDKILLDDGSVLREIHIKINILPVDDSTPVVRVGEKLIVAEGTKAVISHVHIDVRDIDTEEDNILCVITDRPQNGFIENTAIMPGSEISGAGNAVSAFTVSDLRHGSVNYVQNAHKHSEPLNDRFRVQCSDGVNLAEKVGIFVQILPVNDEKPNVLLKDFVVVEGKSLTLQSPLVEVTDLDIPADTLRLVIVQPPLHGQILKQTQSGNVLVDRFIINKSMESDPVMYMHDNSETTLDSFEFVLTDGVHNVTRSVQITVIPVDDITPNLKINKGLVIENIGGNKKITSKVLLAEDEDSALENITYIVQRVPQYGVLAKLGRNGFSNLTFDDNFTQIDINNNLMQYFHIGKEAKRDIIKFDLTDGKNKLSDQSFSVIIRGMDVVYPEIYNQGLRLPEEGIAVLMYDLLRGAGLRNTADNLMFNITSPPQHGQVEHVDQAGAPVTLFSLFNINANEIRYVHNSEDEIRMDLFEFDVSSGTNNVSQTFKISIIPDDNKLPVLMYNTMRLREGEHILINSSLLKAVDMDTDDEHVTFTVTQVPLHGNVLYNFSRIVTRFTQQEMNNKLISYQHDGTETLSDSFIFTVTDGTNFQFYVPGSPLPTRRPQEMTIDIIPVDNGLPRVAVNTGIKWLKQLGVGPSSDPEIGITLTRQHLQVEDKTSPWKTLRFVITVPPKHGYIRNLQRGLTPVNVWTQGKLDQEAIQYVLNPKENATEDSFFFKVIDEGNNALENQPFQLSWSWLAFKTSNITVHETDEVVEVSVLRRGNLAESSYVSINVTDSTAFLGKDVSRQFVQQVQFNPGQWEKKWRLPLRDDAVFEGAETLMLHLTEPTYAVLEHPATATVTILDTEDEARVFFPETVYRVMENVSYIDVPIHRLGDLSQDLKVICYTAQVTATGTPADKVDSFYDYVSRPENENSVVKFASGEDKKTCRVTVIDDTLFEEEEKFHVLLGQPKGGRLGEHIQADVHILQDPADEPVFYFDAPSYEVDESSGQMEVKVWKTGTDLSRPSSVTVRSDSTNNTPAIAGTDYMPVMRILDFSPGEMTKVLTLSILDDLPLPRIQGPRTFLLHLQQPVGGAISLPSTTTITIDDSLSDLPRMQFGSAEYHILESEGHVVAMVTRSGDISSQSWVTCYTRQASATAGRDFVDRPNSNASLVVFKPNQRQAECKVTLLDDSVREHEESFRLLLGSPGSELETTGGHLAGGATLGGQTTTRILMDDPEDNPVIQFSEEHYTVNEPIIKGDVTVLQVPVVRQGDVSSTSSVRVFTKSGSATAGRDFNELHTEFVFGVGEVEKTAKLEILYDEDLENSESFTLHLEPDSPSSDTVLGTSSVIITIEENSKLADVIFPDPPVVVSLDRYDDMADAINSRPQQGFPLICVSPCNPRHPRYQSMRWICKEEGIADDHSKYRWRVGPPSGSQGAHSPLHDLETNTVFTNTRHVTLDSIYFSAGSRVQCYARAVNTAGEPGQEVASAVVTIDTRPGPCPRRNHGHLGADPFTARLQYAGPADPHYPNTVRLSVQVPHTDGLFPAVSTNVLSNFEYALSHDGYRKAQHRCSNLLDVQEYRTTYGFITNQTKQMVYNKELLPLQYSELRSNKTLRFYKNLDLESCLWTFETYYDMSELVSDCGGVVDTDRQILNSRQSYVSLRVPLYVTYLYYTSAPAPGWRNHNLRTQLHLQFVYNTATPWHEGIRSTPTDDQLDGKIYPSSIRIGADSRLTVTLRTIPDFRGHYISMHQGVGRNSSVTSVDRPDLNFDLALLNTEPTFDKPTQIWQIKSKTVLKDYSGLYKIRLWPCKVQTKQPYTPNAPCSPSDPVTFDLPLTVQQVSDAVPSRYSLDAEFRVMRRRDLWLSTNLHSIVMEEDDTTFAPGDTVYGRVDVDPVQALGGEHRLTIHTVLLCAGRDGYIPKYEPDQGQYGCVEDSHNLQAVVRLLDVDSPRTIDSVYNSLPLHVKSARQDAHAHDLHHMPGADGFQFDSTPLFQVHSGEQWFLHAIYSIQSINSINRRSTLQHAVVRHTSKSTAHHSLVSRSLDDVRGVGDGKQGTNLAPLLLDVYGKSLNAENHTDKMKEEDNGQMAMIAALIGVGIFLLIAIFVLVIFIRHHRKHASPPPTPSGTITVMSTSTGQTRVISNTHYFKPRDHAEV